MESKQGHSIWYVSLLGQQKIKSNIMNLDLHKTANWRSLTFSTVVNKAKSPFDVAYRELASYQKGWPIYLF